MDAGGGVLATISVFESEDAAEESTAAAATWVQENMAQLVPNPPQVTKGDTTGVSAEVRSKTLNRGCPAGHPAGQLQSSEHEPL